MGLQFEEVHLTFLESLKHQMLPSGLFPHSSSLEMSRSWSLMSPNADGESCAQLGSLSPQTRKGSRGPNAAEH